ncbi:MAG: thiolase domain-containing protein [Acidimicrobiales bacterium]|nr:MAG: thiolase domain-containing protein [Acidimicrobiales bacterium]
MAERCAVIVVGQTHHTACRADVSIAGLVREAVDRALEHVRRLADDDRVDVGDADAGRLEGVAMPELWLADALDAHGKPLFRVHTAGSVGGSTAIVAAQHVMGGIHKRVLTIGFEKQSDGNAMWALSVPIPFGMPVHAGAGGYFSPIVRTYIARYDVPVHIGAMVAVKDRGNALRNPYAHLHDEGLTLEKAMESTMLWDPIRFVETCPSSDGAIALVLADEATADAHVADTGRPAAWIHATAMRSEPTIFAGREQVSPVAGEMCAADLWRKGGITDPAEEIDAVEMYVPFSWFEPMWLENLGFAPKGDGWRWVEDGVTEMTGSLPVNASGGVLSSNPIGASGMLRFGEAAMQVMGIAGAHQIGDVRKAVGHAYGGGSQFFAMWLVGRDKP